MRFGLYERERMKISDLREELGLSQEGFGNLLGLKSKSYVSEIENGARCSVKVALEIERLSKGRIPAASLNPDVGLVEQARGLTGEAA